MGKGETRNLGRGGGVYFFLRGQKRRYKTKKGEIGGGRPRSGVFVAKRPKGDSRLRRIREE